MKLFLLYFLISLFLQCHTMRCDRQHLIIIVPGTWTFKEKWYTLGGNFFEELQKTAQFLGKKVIPFRWVSLNQEARRIGAAQELAHQIHTLDKYDIEIVAHSHGVNVALGASQILAQKNSTQKIKTLYALGVPVHEDSYAPHMDFIEKIYNLYSLNDWVQTIWAYQRVFKEHPRIFNIHAFINQKEPTHEELHQAITGKWLLYLPQLIQHNRSVLHLSEKESPCSHEDPNFEEKLSFENDPPLNLQALGDFY